MLIYKKYEFSRGDPLPPSSTWNPSIKIFTKVTYKTNKILMESNKFLFHISLGSGISVCYKWTKEFNAMKKYKQCL